MGPWRPDQKKRKERNLSKNKLKVTVKGEVSLLERRDLNKNGSYFMSFFVALLRGSEGFMVDAARL